MDNFKIKPLNVKELTLISLFIALQIILTRFVSVQTPIVRLDFNFLALALCSMIFGPVWGGVAAVVADFLGVTLFTSFGYFPGFSLSMLLEGVIYGLFLYNKPVTFLRVGIAVVIINLFVSLGLGTLWVTILTGQGFIALLPARVTKVAVMIPLQIILIPLVWNTIGSRVAVLTAANGSDN